MSILGAGARIVRRVARFCTTDASSVGAAGRAWRFCVFVPVFSCWYALVKIHRACGGRLELRGTSASGASFRCAPPDLVQMYVLLFGRWEPDLTSFIRRRLTGGDTFVDVGANIGYFTLDAAREVGEHGRVVAIEASPRIHETLRETVEADACGAVVRVVHCAVADAPGTLTVFAGPDHNLGLTTTVAGRGFTAEAEVDAAPLADALTDQEIASTRLVKIDVEGGEVAVLAGMDEFLDRARQDVEILVELSPQWWSDSSKRPDEILASFESRGFNVYEIDNDYWPWRYLWPNAVRRPRRVTRRLDERVHRLDLVLSRVDAEVL